MSIQYTAPGFEPTTRKYLFDANLTSVWKFLLFRNRNVSVRSGPSRFFPVPVLLEHEWQDHLKTIDHVQRFGLSQILIKHLFKKELLKWAAPIGLFSFIFSHFQTNMNTIFTTN